MHVAAKDSVADAIKPISVIEQCEILLDLSMSKIMPVSDAG